MILRLFYLLFAGLLLATGSHAQTPIPELNRVRGVWDLNGNLFSYWSAQPPVSLVGFSTAPGYPVEAGYQFLRLTPKLTNAQYLSVPTVGGPNGFSGAAYMNNWTLVMDLRIPQVGTSTDPRANIYLFQDHISTVAGIGAGDDAECFIGPRGSLNIAGAGLVAPDNTFPRNVWKRLGIRATYNPSTNRQAIQYFLDGSPIGFPGIVDADSRYALEQAVYLFTDNDGETAPVDVNSVGFWSLSLSNSSVAAMGAASAGGLNWAGLPPANSFPPLPTLTGILKSGTVNTTFTAAIQQNDGLLSIQDPVLAGTVARVTLQLPAADGKIPGKPRHYFDGLVTADVLANGDCKIITQTFLSVLPDVSYGLRDIEPMGNILFERVVTLLRFDGIFARDIKLHLPIGCQATASPTSRRMKPALTFQGIGLDLTANLTPVAPVVGFGAVTVGGDSGQPFYLCFDRLPVRWRTNTLNWDHAAGTLTAPADLNFNLHHRESGIAAMAALSRQRESNDGLFRYATQFANDLVLAARSGGYVSLNRAAVRLNPTKFGGTTAQYKTHFPMGWSVNWTGFSSQLQIQNDAVSALSKLVSAGSLATDYERGCPDPECDGPLPALPKSNRAMSFAPDASEWKFTKDLGLSASGIPSVAFGTMLQWGVSSFGIAQQVVQNFTSSRAMVAGTVLEGLERTTIPADSPAALLLSGHTTPVSSSVTERPGTAAYATGSADYPGLNFRVPGTGFTAQSLLAGAVTAPYPLTGNSKYYTRISGVSGKHEAVANSNTQFTALGGSTFTVSALRLSYLSGRNKGSGVQGNCLVKTPLNTSFPLAFDRLLFGCSGALLGANLSPLQPAFMLSYWGNLFTPTALDFPQPKTCPSPGPGVGFIRLAGSSVFPALSGTAMTGTIGFYAGDIVTESLPVVDGLPIANGLGAISRFQPNGPVLVMRSDGTGWKVQPQGAAYLNRFELRDSAGVGTINLHGLADVPFFVDMPVHLSTSSSSTSNTASPVFFRLPLAKEKYYDPTHRGYPESTNLNSFLTTGAYDPHAEKSWLNLVDFDFPLMQVPGRKFQSRVPKVDNALRILTLEQKVLGLSPQNAELSFKGEAGFDAGDILAGITVDGILAATGELFPNVSSNAVNGITSGASAIASFDELLSDDLGEVLSLDAVAGSIATNLHSQLTGAPTAATLNNVKALLAQNMDELFGSGTTGLSGEWRRALQSKLNALDDPASTTDRLDRLQSTVDQAGEVLSLANSLRSRMGVSAITGEAVARLETARREVSAAVARVRTGIATARLALNSGGNLALVLAEALPPQNSSLGTDLNDLAQLALDDLQDKWNAQATAQGAAFFTDHPVSELRADLRAALKDRVLGSAFGSQALSILRMHLSDTQFELRQSVDGTLDLLKNAAKDAISDTAKGVLGELGAFTGMGQVTGHARINGDTLNELRIDGKVHLAVGGETVGSSDSLKVDGYFILRDVDSTTPDGACRATFGAVSEILVGASGSYSWGARSPGDSGTTGLAINGKFTLDNTRSIIGLAGDVALLGELGFQDIVFRDLKLGFGFGAGDAYIYGRGSADLSAMDVTAGVFFGQTCASNLDILKNVDKDITAVVSTLGLNPAQTFLGAAVYAEGSMSLMPIIGIPPSCLLDLRVGGGQGVFFFKQGEQLVAGIKQSMSVRGEILCLVDVTGQLAYVIAGSGNLDGSNLKVSGLGRATVRGEVGIDPFSWDFEKSLTMRVNAAPLTYKLDY